MPIYVTGLKELRKELKAVPDASVRELNAALKGIAVKVTARARELTPVKSGKMAASAKPFVSAKGAGVRYSHPGASVQEFATDYLRAAPGRADGKGHRATKKHINLGGMSASAGGMVPVHMVNVTAKGDGGGRFAHKAVDELGPVLIEETFEKILEVVRCHGWLA